MANPHRSSSFRAWPGYTEELFKLHFGLCSSGATKSRTSGVGTPENYAFPGRGGTRLPEMKRQELSIFEQLLSVNASPSAMSYPPVAKLLPHGPPMMLVDSIVDETEGGLVCRVVIAPDFPFLKDGEAELVVCVELIAQTVACLPGRVDHKKGTPPRPGLLVGCRDARFSGEPLRPGDDLTVAVQTRWVREPVACFVGSVDRASARIADAEVVVVATNDVATAMEAMHGAS